MNFHDKYIGELFITKEINEFHTKKDLEGFVWTLALIGS